MPTLGNDVIPVQNGSAPAVSHPVWLRKTPQLPEYTAKGEGVSPGGLSRGTWETPHTGSSEQPICERKTRPSDNKNQDHAWHAAAFLKIGGKAISPYLYRLIPVSIDV